VRVKIVKSQQTEQLKYNNYVNSCYTQRYSHRILLQSLSEQLSERNNSSLFQTENIQGTS